MKRQAAAIRNIIVALAIVSLSAGCARVNKYNEIYKSDRKKISLSWWGTDERHKYMLDGIRDFEKKNPGIDVECEYGIWEGFERRNRMAMASHTASDIMLINFNWLDIYSSDGNGYYDLYDLSDEIDLTQYSETDLKTGEKNGKLNAIPIAYNSTIFFFNEDIYDSYGLELPKTWDDLLTSAEVMKKDGIYPIGMVKKHFFISMVAHFEQQSGRKFFTDSGKLNIDAADMQDILIFYKRMVDAKAIVPVSEFDTNDFIKGKSAGIVAWINDGTKYGKALEEAGDTIICSEFISMDGAKLCGWYKKPATLYAMSNNTSNPREAGMLLNYLLNDSEMAKKQGIEKGFPISRAASEAIEDHTDLPAYARIANDLIRDEDHKLGIMTPEMENADVIDSFKNGSDKYIYGQASLEDCASEIVENMQKALTDEDEK
ncbi:MAG: carbohydrate ABC transporter substrate-binding protein [Lachnospiraceae bacterium]|nr:carbohydrate ABC transporter substrate-binding protein [Lachnospiraceae bacterium]